MIEKLTNNLKSTITTTKMFYEVENINAVVKVINKELASNEIIDSLKLEYAVLKKLRKTGISPIPINEEEDENTYKIVLYDDDFLYLNEFISSSKLDHKSTIQIMVNIIDALAIVHEHDIILNNLSPHNIKISPLTFEVKFINFGVSELFNMNVNYAENTFNTIGDALYMAPEQFGRIKTNIDYRTNIYSIGVVFYECITGKRPFESDNLMKLIQLHTAKNAVFDISKFNNSNFLADTIKKMISKDKRDRHQSIQAISSDLKLYLAFLNNKTEKADLVHSSSDSLVKLEISNKLFGRDIILSTLNNELMKVENGGTIFHFVHGSAGVGKSAIVNSIEFASRSEKAFFVSVKADQYIQDIPDVIISKLLSEICTQILSENDTTKISWGKLFKKNLQGNERIIVDLAPNFEKIIEKVNQIQKLGNIEAKNRTHFTIHNFIRTVASKEHPLVLLIDDIQWCDYSSLSFLKTLIDEGAIPYVYLLGTYRSLSEMDESAKKQLLEGILLNDKVNDTQIEPLPVSAIGELLRDTFSKYSGDINKIAQLIEEKTNGNPFYAKALIKTLYDKGDIFYREDSWHWKLNKIHQMTISSNVVDFLVASMLKLSTDCLETMKKASCIGKHFSLADLIENESEKIVLIKGLNEAINLNYIHTDANNHKLILETILESDIHSVSDVNIHLYFQHDRVREAAYSLLLPEVKKEHHLQIARRLLLKYETIALKDIDAKKLMYIIDHYDKAIDLVTDNVEKLKIVRYKLDLGVKARTTDYLASYVYLSSAETIFKDALWKIDRYLAKKLLFELSISAFLNSKHTLAGDLIETLLTQADNNYEKALLYSEKTTQWATIGRNEDALKEAFEGLRYLNFKLKKTPSKLDILREMLIVKRLLAKKSDEEIIDLKECEDENIRLTTKMLVVAGPPALQLGEGNLFALIILCAVKLTLLHGSSEDSPVILGGFSSILAGAFGDYVEAYKYSNIAMGMNKRFSNLRTASRVYHLHASFCMHWMEHWKEIDHTLQEGMDVAFKSGDFMYLAFMSFHIHSWNPELNLEDLYKKKLMQRKIIQSSNYQNIIDEIDMFLSFLLNLMDRTMDDYTLDTNTYNALERLKITKSNGFTTGVTAYYIWMAEINFLYLNYDVAKEMITNAEGTLDSIVGLPYALRYHLMSFLIHNKYDDNVSRRKSNRELKWMKKLASINPINYDHLYKWMLALKYSKHGSMSVTMAYFDEALNLADKGGWRKDLAMIHESIARYLMDKHLDSLATEYIERAYQYFEKWGANRKLRFMRNEFPMLEELRLNSMNILEADTFDQVNAELDLITMIKASEKISKGLDLTKIIESIMIILMENVGAEKCCVLENINSVFNVSAKADVNSHEISHYDDLNYVMVNDISRTIISRVIETEEIVVYANAFQSPDFTKDEYIQSRKVKSILCLPLFVKERFAGILYVENRHIENVFTKRRLELINILVRNMVVSYENALLYKTLKDHNETLEMEVEKRTEQLRVMASMDALTKTNNRYSMLNRLEDEVKLVQDEDHQAFSILLIDVDNFKKFNDTYGHDCGDFVLVSLASHLKALISEDDMLARWGGEEFIILLSNTEKEKAFKIAQRICNNISSEEYFYEAKRLCVTLTIGVSEYTKENKDVESVISNADKALYSGKKTGKNKAVLYHNELDEWE